VIVKTFELDREKYDLSKHDYLLTTTEYTYGTTCLAKQIIHRKLTDRILQRVKHPRPALTAEQDCYYISKTDSSQCRQIEFETFMRLFNAFNQHDVKLAQEQYELVHYKDKHGNAAFIGIAVLKEEDETVIAQIQFQNIGELEAFVLPEWLINPNSLPQSGNCFCNIITE